ncbi:hypothetical protein FQR65_LT06239 [Abscondita terminalis]|nr:hypothetical protein FQR65_LT06239 [Abscondita terminalis]
MNQQRSVNCETVDVEENDFFSIISAVWWDRKDFFFTLHHLGAVTCKYIREIFASNNVKEDSSIRIIDVGCGGGIVSEAIARDGYTVNGIDVNNNLIRVAKEHAALDKALTNLTYHVASANDEALLNPEQYDVVILTYVLQHVKNHEILIRDCIKLLKPGGLIFIAAIGKTFQSFVTIKIIFERIKRTFTAGGHHWKNFIRYSTVESILKKNACTVINRSGVRCKTKIKWETCDNLDVFYILCASKNYE